MLAQISKTDSGLLVEYAGYSYRRVDGAWQMLSQAGKWFECKVRDPQVKNQVADYEYCLRTYTEYEGPDYPRASKKGNVGKFFRELQRRELYAVTKNLFAPVKLKYDARAENLARYNREMATRMRAPLNRKYLVGNS